MLVSYLIQKSLHGLGEGQGSSIYIGTPIGISDKGFIYKSKEQYQIRKGFSVYRLPFLLSSPLT